MTPERWQRVKDVLDAVEESSGQEREAALDRLCAGDPELRREVESLLAQEARIGIFEPDASLVPPRQIGPYRVEKLLGAGGMGAVYLASRSDDQYQKRVAIKVIQGMAGLDLERRFRNERQILAGLEHPFIARLLDGGALEDSRPYLVMEYVEGQRIDEYVDQRQLPIQEILHLFLKVCAAVEFAHQNLVVHRDLKPGNILVTGSGEPRLLDFGIAKVMAEGAADVESTRPFERLLTPSSASPEQAAGGPVTTASDVYSLGVLLYRLLTGVSPYAAAPNFREDPAGIIRSYEPPLASAARVRQGREARLLKGDLDTVLRKALEKDPGRRYRTVDRLAADIRRYLDGRPVLARRASYWYRTGKFIRRNRLPVAASMVLAAAIAAGVGGTVWYARRAQAEKARADRRFEALRRLSESLLFEFHDAIQNLPGSTDARALVVRRALQYLDQLASENPEPAVERDLASAYIRIGGILAGERSAHLGGASAVSNAIASYEKAYAIRRRLAAAKPSDPGLRRDLLESLGTLAEGKRMQGDLANALAYYQRRLDIIGQVPEAERPADLRYMLGTTFAAMSTVYRAQGSLDQALDCSRRSLAVRQALLDADPGSVRARRVVGLSHEFVGYALSAKHDYAAAAREHSAALAQFDPLAARDPRNIDLQRNVYVAESNLCEALARGGAVASAGSHCRRSVDVAEAMHRADPDNVQAIEDLAAACATMGFALDTAKEPAPALSWERRGVEQYGQAIAKAPDSLDTRQAYAEALFEAGRIEKELGDRRACQDLVKARDTLARLAAVSPSDRTIAAALVERSVYGCPTVQAGR